MIFLTVVAVKYWHEQWLNLLEAKRITLIHSVFLVFAYREIEKWREIKILYILTSQLYEMHMSLTATKQTILHPQPITNNSWYERHMI